MSNIRPIEEGRGVGFCSYQPLPEYAALYREEQVGRYYNYHFTEKNFAWPEDAAIGGRFVIDGFSPNLNKSLHVGHLRQLALATSLRQMLPRSAFVALLGASQGVYRYAQKELDEWFKFAGYKATLYYDVLLPRDLEFVIRRTAEDGELCGCEVFDGPQGPVIVVRSDGRPTYAFHEISFANTVGPTHYLTGAEQREHFMSLGLESKHLPMGLVLGQNGKKLKSRKGLDQNAAAENATAEEVIQEVISHLEPTAEPRKLAWNVLAWNFLHVARPQNVQFDSQKWTRPESPGMYITYTLARILSALNYNDPSVTFADVPAPDGLLPSDIELLGWVAYKTHWLNKSCDNFDPSPLANYAHDLARKLGEVYHREKIQGGRPAFQYAVCRAAGALLRTMRLLGMKPLTSV